jgi:hypothetical protein
MTTSSSDVWFEVFPGPRIPDVLAYVVGTWDWLQRTFASAVSFDRGETDLTDNLCEALEDRDRRRAGGIDCDFQPETWELRRCANGRTTRIARADIRVMLGVPGTPHLVIEFKKLDGSADGRWRYCFDGMNRFVEGKYAVGHTHGVMCGFSPNDLAGEAAAMAAYIADDEYTRRLCCIADAAGSVITAPSQADPARAKFDTSHNRPGVGTEAPILILHMLLPCPLRNIPATATKRKVAAKPSKRIRKRQ